MRKYTLVFTQEAEDDFDQIIDYIATENPVRALSFIEELRDSLINTLEVAPKGGRRILNARFFVFGNYIAVYDVDHAHNRVVIHMVTHASREWRKLFKARMS